jgi:hypothetical protein
MTIRDDVEELREIGVELERLKRLRFLRWVLKVFLIGFFIGRDVDARVSAARIRRDRVVKRVRGFFDEAERLADSNPSEEELFLARGKGKKKKRGSFCCSVAMLAVLLSSSVLRRRV